MKRHQDHEIHEAWRAAHYKDADRNDKLIINLRDLSHTMRFLYEGKGSQKRILIVLNEMGRTTQRELTEIRQRGNRKAGNRWAYYANHERDGSSDDEHRTHRRRQKISIRSCRTAKSAA